LDVVQLFWTKAAAAAFASEVKRLSLHVQ
jgi:hypothetical protein